MLDWSACSPDLNPIKHVWNQPGRAVHLNTICVMYDCSYKRSGTDSHRPIVNSMRAGVAACIDARLLVPLNTESRYSWIITFVTSCVHVGICNFQCITHPSSHPCMSLIYPPPPNLPQNWHELAPVNGSQYAKLPINNILNYIRYGPKHLKFIAVQKSQTIFKLCNFPA